MDIKTPYIWKNWEFLEWDNTLEHNLTHTLHYGWWVFEGIRFYDTEKWPKVFRLDTHIDRLLYSAKVMWMDLDYSRAELIQATIDTVAKNGEKSGYIRPIIFYWYGKMWLYPKGATIDTAISVWKWWRYISDDAITVKVSKTRRIHPATTDMAAKICGNYANSILVSLEVHNGWFQEWLLLDTEGFIAEGPGENIFLVTADNQVFTPELGTILPGITRATIIELLKKELWIDVIETKIMPSELSSFKEAFFTWTAAEVTAIWSITQENWEKVLFSSGDENSLTNKIKKIYLDVVSWKNEKYKNWLY